MNPIDQFAAAQFASDECGDTLWNEENLNPPLTKVQGHAKKPSITESEMEKAALTDDLSSVKKEGMLGESSEEF